MSARLAQTAPAGRSHRAASIAGARVAAGLAEIWLAAAFFAGRLTPPELLLVHCGIVAAFAAIVGLAGRSVTGPGWLDVALLWLTGPLAVIDLVWRRDVRAAGAERPAPAAEPVRSRAEQIAADIDAGRRPRHHPQPGPTLVDRMTEGDLQTQQFAIAMLSVRYRPEMHPALMAALQSRIPAARVQAAAVFAKLRERDTAAAKALLREPDAAPGPGAAAWDLARSAFLDPHTAERLRALAAACADPPARADAP